MKRIAAMTIIKGEGGILPIYNDKVNAELIRRQQAQEKIYNAKLEELQTVKEHRNRLLAERRETLNRLNRRQRQESYLWWKIKDRISTAWGTIWCVGMLLGLWDEIRAE